ncbi:outer membrane protein assembly factor BamE [Pantoea sp. Aalb]|uniref:outer membrane protein assembly factor BamE n=1 Tax=Pantoea sp. Aalb TaxID=2576762 RepID=UPI0013277C8B|nr:outer membrane protein assembly factor BamE [Pantoea sp. Aalb]MXP67237.1 outer membrane protein assembly factor BamE [Pantoea sp. Aalb]
MYSKMMTIITIIIFLLTTGCSNIKSIVYHPDIYQGNYLIAKDIAKVHIGMTQEQVAYILGAPMMYSIFGNNTWYYMVRKKLGNHPIKQQTLTLNFDINNKLIKINNIYFTIDNQ